MFLRNNWSNCGIKTVTWVLRGDNRANYYIILITKCKTLTAAQSCKTWGMVTGEWGFCLQECEPSFFQGCQEIAVGDTCRYLEMHKGN